MKHRDIFRVPARVERRSKIAKAWKSGNETRSESEDLGWFIVITLGAQEFSFLHGDDKLVLSEPQVNLIIEYTVPDAQS